MTTRITIDPAFVVGPVRRRTFGSFVEHLGRCVYTGIFEPDHPQADEAGSAPTCSTSCGNSGSARSATRVPVTTIIAAICAIWTEDQPPVFSDWSSPTITWASRLSVSGIVPDCPPPDHWTSQFEVAVTV